jgi:hypothetical protein
MLPGDLLAPEFGAALVVTLAAGLMRGFSGFGNALMMAPTLSVLYGPPVAVPTVLLAELAIGAQVVPAALAKVRWRELAGIAVPAALAVPFGGYLLGILDPKVVTVVIGLVVATSIAGPPVILYLLSGPDSARYNRATLTVYFVLVTLATYPMLFVNGLLTLGTLLFAASLVPVLMAGVWLGSRLFTGASETLYRRVALVFLLAVAAVAIAA